MGLIKDFEAFIMRGNVVDLAIAVVIGAAFSGVVGALVADLITPLITAIVGKPDFSALYFTINNSRFLYGAFLNALIAFLISAAVVYFFIVRPLNLLLELRHTKPSPDPTVRDCPYCFNSIPTKATRCGFCTSEVSAVKSGA